MNPRATIAFFLLGLLLVTGCADRSQKGAIIQGIGKLNLVDSPGLTLHTTSSAGATRPGFASQDFFSEVIAEKGAELPPDLANSVAQQIQTYLRQSGCNVTGGGGAQGFGYTEASGVKNPNIIQSASMYFELNRSQGRVDVFVVERDYQFDGKHIVGQLIVLVRSS